MTSHQPFWCHFFGVAFKPILVSLSWQRWFTVCQVNWRVSAPTLAALVISHAVCGKASLWGPCISKPPQLWAEFTAGLRTRLSKACPLKWTRQRLVISIPLVLHFSCGSIELLSCCRRFFFWSLFDLWSLMHHFTIFFTWGCLRRRKGRQALEWIRQPSEIFVVPSSEMIHVNYKWESNTLVNNWKHELKKPVWNKLQIWWQDWLCVAAPACPSSHECRRQSCRLCVQDLNDASCFRWAQRNKNKHSWKPLGGKA